MNDLKEAVKKLFKFKLECQVDPKRFPAFFGEGYCNEDEKCPFFSESILYLMFGKEDARTILGLINNVIREAGIDVSELEMELDEEYERERKCLRPVGIKSYSNADGIRNDDGKLRIWTPHMPTH